MVPPSNTIFYRYTQEQALSSFPDILEPCLPTSNAILTRLLSPHNTPDRHILYAATCPPSSSAKDENHTILFSDRSRHLESHVWVFNPLFMKATSALSETEKDLLAHHAQQLLSFVKDTQIPESSGWPFSSTIKFAAIHESMHAYIVSAASSRNGSIIYDTLWNQWSIDLSSPILSTASIPSLLGGWRNGKVPEENLEIVIKHSAIKRQKETLKVLSSHCLINERNEMVAWAFIGLDGALCTMHVLEEFRGRGLAKSVARGLLVQYREEGDNERGKQGSGWVHAEVGEGNVASEGVMRALGAVKRFRTGYTGIDVEKMI